MHFENICVIIKTQNTKGRVFMKKLIAVLLSFTMIATMFAFSGSAEDNSVTDYPVIIVAGYSSSQLYDADTGEHVWGLDMDEIFGKVEEDILPLLAGLGAMPFGNYDMFMDTLGPGAIEILEKMRCNPDGSSTYNLQRYRSTAAETNSAYLKEIFPDGNFRHELDMQAYLEDIIGLENIYNFQCDFRMGAEFCANQLRDFIESVKEHSGKDKVNLLAISHGGQVSATYLNLYGYEQNVDNAVLTVPAIGGAGIAYDILANNVELDEECLLRFVIHGMRWEEDYDWLVKAQQLGFLDDLLEAFIPYIQEIAQYWGSIWDFLPTDLYEELKAERLDPVANAAIIEKSDRYHYEILATMNEKLQKCIDEYGMNVTIIAGTGNRIVSGLNVDSDGIITTNGATGATCAPYGMRFADGYVQVNPCDGKNKISPAMNVDASTAYLPDNTWFVDGLFHGMTYWDPFCRSLMMTNLLTDEITDVYSDENYPQFKYTTNPSHQVYAEFDGCEPGFLDGNAQKLTVTNCSEVNSIKLSAIYCDGAELNFDVEKTELAPGESVEISFSGEIPAVSKKVINITICYTTGTVTPVGYRTQAFTLVNGEAVANEGGYVSAEAVTPLDLLLGQGAMEFLRSLGLKELFSMLYTIIFCNLQNIAFV